MNRKEDAPAPDEVDAGGPAKSWLLGLKTKRASLEARYRMGQGFFAGALSSMAQ